jgi:hypothetical protein
MSQIKGSFPMSQADFHPQLGEQSCQSVCLPRTAHPCSWVSSQAILPDPEQDETTHLWIRVPADDQANGSWGTLAQDGMHFA